MATTPSKLPAAPAKPAATKTLAQAKAEAAAAKAAQDKAIAAQVAAAAAAKAKQQADAAAAKKAADTKAMLEKDILAKINSATSQSQLDMYLKQAKDAGVVVPAATVTAATTAMKKAAADKAAAEAEASRIANEKAAAAAKAAQEKAAVEKAAADKLAAEKAAAEAEKAAAEKAIADKLAAEKAAAEAEKAAAAKAAADAKAAQEKAAAEKAAQEKAAAEKAAAERAAAKLGEKYNTELANATSPEQVDAIKAKAAAEGATLNQGYLDRAAQIIQQKATAATTAKQQELNSTYEQQLVGATTQAEVNEILAKAKDAGAVLNPGYIDQAKTIAGQHEAAALKAQQDQLTQTYLTQLNAATTPEEIQSIADKASQAGVPLNTGYIDRANTVVSQQQAAAAEAKQAERSDFYNQQMLNANTPQEVQAVVDKAAAEGVTLNSGYIDRANQAAGDKMAQAQAKTEFALAAENFSQTLPTPGSAEFNNLSGNQFDVTGPDGKIYKAVPANTATGQPAGWYVSSDQGSTFADLTNPEQKATAKDLQGVIQSNLDIVNQQAQQQRTDLIAEQKAAQENDFFSSDLFKVIAVAALATIAAPYVSSLFAEGAAAGAAGAGEAAGAISAGEAAATASSMAEAGATVGEISSTLQSAGFLESAATAIADTASGIYSGIVDAVTVAAQGGVTPDMLAMANATADPIAALNAAAGWTAADTAYLAAIGVPASVIATAEATNVAMGLEASGAGASTATATATPEAQTIAEQISTQPVAPTGAETAATGPIAPETALTELNAEQTAELMKNIDPNMINNLNPVSTGSAGGTSSMFSGPSMNPITNLVTNAGVTNPILSGALTGAGTGSAINLLTGQPITADSLLTGALYGGVAGAIGPGVGAGTMFGGDSINPISNLVTNAGITNPILAGALTGAGTGAVVNLLTGQPITTDSLLMSGLGGGVAGGIGSVLPDMGTGVVGSGLAGAATNLGATAVVSLVTGQPITAQTLAGAALIGGAIGAGSQAYSDAYGNTTYRYDDGSSLTVNSKGSPVSVTDNTGAKVPVAAIDTRTGQTKELPPVEDRVGTPVAPSAPPAGTVAVQGADGSTLYTDGQNYYTADGTLTNIANPTPGGATDTAKLSPGNQQIISDATNDFNSGKSSWDEASARINQAVRNDINSGYLTNNGDGTYTAPDGTTYFMNADTGMYDARVGVPGGTGSGADTAPVVPADQPAAPPAVAPTESTTPAVVVPSTPPSTPTVTAPTVPVTETPTVTAPTVPVTETPTTVITPGPVAPGTGTTPGTGAGTTPGAGGTSTTGGAGTGGSGGGVGTVDTGIPEIVITEPRLPVVPPAAEPPVYVPPVVTPPVTTAPVTPSVPDVVPETPSVTPPEVVTEPPVTPPEVVTPPDTTVVYPPIYVPPVTPPKVEIPGYGPLGPIEWGKVGKVNLPGTNPGWFTDVPQQYAPQGVRSQFYWGQHPYQTGERFSPEQYKQVNAPVAPWGLQQMYNPQAQTIQSLLQGVQKAAATAPYNLPAAPKV